MQYFKTERLLMAVGAATGGIAITGQFYLLMLNRTASIPETIARFFGYFTILTNILTALCFTFLLLKPGTKAGRFFARPATRTAIALYITVVGIVYNVVLRFLWNPQGLQSIIDELLHVVIPVLFIVYWFLFVPKDTLKWKQAFPWLVYPAIYCIYSLWRGTVAGFYPYPFIDAGLLGYQRVFINIAGLIMVFLILSWIFIGIAKWRARQPAGKR